MKLETVGDLVSLLKLNMQPHAANAEIAKHAQTLVGPRTGDVGETDFGLEDIDPRTRIDQVGDSAGTTVYQIHVPELQPKIRRTMCEFGWAFENRLPVKIDARNPAFPKLYVDIDQSQATGATCPYLYAKVSNAPPGQQVLDEWGVLTPLKEARHGIGWNTAVSMHR